MKREIIKIQQGNETNLSIRALLPDGKTQVPVSLGNGFRPEHVAFVINGHEIPTDFTVKDKLLVVPISSDLVAAKYGIHVTGHLVTMNAHGAVGEFNHANPGNVNLDDLVVVGADVDCNFYEAFEIVPYSDNIRYDNYYTDIFIVGLPDSTYEQLRKEYEKKIAEAEEAKAYWQQQALNLDGVAKQGDNPEATNSAIYDLIYHGGGGGGGGGLTPEQWDKIAKEHTLSEIKSMLAAYQTANAAKLDTIIANTSLTAAQADEDWQNIGPA